MLDATKSLVQVDRAIVSDPTPSSEPSPESNADDATIRAHRTKLDFRLKLREVPHKPGVYLMRDRFNRVIYVGKARDLKKRVSQYFMPSRRMTADPKTRALLESIWDLEWHTVFSEPEALLLEGKLIKEYRPRYNVSFRDDKRFLLVRSMCGSSGRGSGSRGCALMMERFILVRSSIPERYGRRWLF